ncbi:RHS repeat-associated core domain-containing protein [Candidatus Uabimicrobium sp. HlEnr_7]|uniref:RHS repeat-associated core domain-containing protein n=1 Tax=Candidatus Uabimicrobium helgolandensis TaxID=3095367 RepID=UPI0035591B94
MLLFTAPAFAQKEWKGETQAFATPDIQKKQVLFTGDTTAVATVEQSGSAGFVIFDGTNFGNFNLLSPITNASVFSNKSSSGEITAVVQGSNIASLFQFQNGSFVPQGDIPAMSGDIEVKNFLVTDAGNGVAIYKKFDSNSGKDQLFAAFGPIGDPANWQESSPIGDVNLDLLSSFNVNFEDSGDGSISAVFKQKDASGNDRLQAQVSFDGGATWVGFPIDTGVGSVLTYRLSQDGQAIIFGQQGTDGLFHTFFSSKLTIFTTPIIVDANNGSSTVGAELQNIGTERYLAINFDIATGDFNAITIQSGQRVSEEILVPGGNNEFIESFTINEQNEGVAVSVAVNNGVEVINARNFENDAFLPVETIANPQEATTGGIAIDINDIGNIIAMFGQTTTNPTFNCYRENQNQGGGLDREVKENDGSVVTTEHPYHNPAVNNPSCVTVAMNKTGNSANCGCSTCKCFNASTSSGVITSGTDANAGDPIILNSLDYIMGMSVLDIAGRGLDFEFQLTYRSRVQFEGRFGNNWSDNHSRRIVPQQDGSVVLYSGRLRGDQYEVVNSEFVSPDFHFKRMIEDDDSFVLLRERDGMIYRFFPIDGSAKEGLLESITTPCGNKITHSYSNEGVIEFSLDSLSRRIDYTTDDRGHITQIKDFIQREVNFVYDDNNNLISITTPAVTGTGFNDFPNGKTCEFTYSEGFNDEKLNNNMLTATFPNEVANNGPARVINTFNANDEILTQQWGGTNDSGVAVGGTITYAKQIINPNPQDNTEIKEQTTVIDRNGNETVFSYNNEGLLLKKEEKTRGIRPGDPASFITLYEYNDIQLNTKITMPEGNSVQFVYNDGAQDQFQKGNLLTVIKTPDAARGGDQQFIRIDYEYEPVYNKILRVKSPRELDPQYQPQNGGANAEGRYTTESIPDYFEADLDTTGCACGFTLQDLIDKFGVDISSVQDRINSGDLNGDGRVDNICGNTIVVRQPNVNLLSGSLQSGVEGSTIQIIESRMAYNKFGQYVFTETPEGEVTTFSYFTEGDPDGDGANILTGNNNDNKPFDTQTGGYLKEMITDDSHSTRYRGNSAPTQIKTQFGYDSVGNRTEIIDGRGIKHTMVFNQLNQLVEATRAADVSGSTEANLVAFAYKSRIFYDANNNVVETQVEIRDDNNPDLPNFLPSIIKYDILDNPIEMQQTISNSEVTITQISYDANENVILTKSPESVNGNQENNTMSCVLDERDLVFTKTSGAGSADERTFTFNIDNNGNITTTVDAEDNNGDGSGEVTTIIFDGFDRVKRTIDAVGNESIVTYDPDSNAILAETFGPVGGASRSSNSTAGNVLLAKSEMLYDEIGRVFQTDTHLFVANGVNTVRPVVLDDNDANPNDGKVTALVDYDRNSRVTFTTSPSPQGARETSSFEYDGAQRRIRVVDAENNEQNIVYDNNSNPIRITRTDVNSAGRIVSETFETINVFDALNRVQRTTNNIGQTSYFTYSSRDLLIRTADAQGPEIVDPLGLFAGNINSEGNISETKYDGLSRSFESTRELRVDGEGGNPLDLSNPSNTDGKITEFTTYDQNSRVINVSDDNGNATIYEYDNLNRLTKTVYADTRETTVEYDKDSNVIRTTDNNGSVCDYVFDGIHRTTTKNITRAANIEGTTQQTYEYDGLSRLTKATDNNNPNDAQDNTTVTRNYDSLSRLVEEQQNGKVISMNWREGADLANCTYPNERVIEYTYDKINRVGEIKDAGATTAIASYDYIGARVIERLYKNGTKFTTLNDEGDSNIGYDDLPRVTQMRHLRPNGKRIQEYEYQYNRVNFKTQKKNLRKNKFSETYALDSLYRVVDFKRAKIKDNNTLGNTSQSQSWQLDGVGNWAKTTIDGEEKTQTVNEVNEYDAFGGVVFVHDDNGNLTDDGERLFTYDALNRIIQINNKANNEVIATYKYDFANRRTSKEFERQQLDTCDTSQGEAVADANTLALYRYNNENGPIIDSSGNGNDIANPKNTTREDGLFNTRSLSFNGQRLKMPLSTTLDNIQDQLTVETFVFVDANDIENLDSSLVKRKGSFNLKINGNRLKPVFAIHTLDGANQPVTTRVRGNVAIPLSTWIHIAGVYDGQSVKIFVNGNLLAEKPLTGNVVIDPTVRTFLGANNFVGNLEETRISNIARVGCAPGGIINKDVRRSFFYSGWRVVEEREQEREAAQAFGDEVITRQFVDGLGIDEHLQMAIYDETGSTIAEERYFHSNHRGDTTAVTDIAGNVVFRFELTTYGEMFVVNSDNDLEEFADFEEIVYGFQGRRLDEETSLMYYRHRYYNQKLGRFVQRDPLGYIDSYGLYEAFGGNPYNYIDPFGKEDKPTVPLNVYSVGFTEEEFSEISSGLKSFYGNFGIEIEIIGKILVKTKDSPNTVKHEISLPRGTASDLDIHEFFERNSDTLEFISADQKTVNYTFSSFLPIRKSDGFPCDHSFWEEIYNNFYNGQNTNIPLFIIVKAEASGGGFTISYERMNDHPYKPVKRDIPETIEEKKEQDRINKKYPCGLMYGRGYVDSVIKTMSHELFHLLTRSGYHYAFYFVDGSIMNNHIVRDTGLPGFTISDKTIPPSQVDFIKEYINKRWPKPSSYTK